MVCKKCGEQLKPKKKFCEQCGSKVNTAGTSKRNVKAGSTHKSAHKQSLKSAHKQSPESAPEQSLKSAPEQSLKSAPEQSIESAPEQSIESAPEQSIESVPEQSPEPAPEQSPEAVHEQSPEAAPEQSPESTPEQSPESTHEQPPESAHEQSLKSAPEQSNESVPEQSPDAAPEQSPDAAPEQPPESAPEQSLKSAPEQPPESAPEQSLKSAPEQSPESAHEQSPESAHEQSPESAHEQSPEAAPEQSPESSEEQSKTSSRKKEFIFCGVVLFLALIVVGIGLFWGQLLSSEPMYEDTVGQEQHYLESESHILEEEYVGLGSGEEDIDANADGEEDAEAGGDEDLMINLEELSDLHRALWAYRQFLTNPQSMLLEHLGEEHEVSWDANTIRHGMLVDFTGEGIPYLVILLHSVEMMLWEPLLVVGYQDEIVIIYQSGIYWDIDSFVSYEITSSSEGVGGLIRVREAGTVGWGETREFLALQNGSFTSVLYTESNFLLWVDDERLDESIEAFRVNSTEVSREEYESAPYHYLSIIESESLLPWNRIGEFVGIRLLVAAIEEELAAGGVMTLAEEEDEVLVAKRTWADFFSLEKWKELPISSMGTNSMLGNVIYVDLDDDGINEALIDIFVFGNGGAENQTSASLSAIRIYALLAVEDGEVLVIYYVYHVEGADETEMLFIMLDIDNDQFVLAREERDWGEDFTVTTILYDYVDGEISRRVKYEGSEHWHIDGFEIWLE